MSDITQHYDDIIAITKQINPQAIYVFGSRATQSYHDDSDLDLLVIAPSDDRPIDRRIKLHRLLREYDRKIGLDILVYTPEEAKLFENEPASFIYNILREGEKIYEAEVV